MKEVSSKIYIFLTLVYSTWKKTNDVLTWLAQFDLKLTKLLQITAILKTNPASSTIPYIPIPQENNTFDRCKGDMLLH